MNLVYEFISVKNDYNYALVRLSFLATRSVILQSQEIETSQLASWESEVRRRGLEKFKEEVNFCLTILEEKNTFSLQFLEANPLAMMKALNDFILVCYSRDYHIGPYEIENINYWLVQSAKQRSESPFAKQSNNIGSWITDFSIIPSIIKTSAGACSVDIKLLTKHNIMADEYLRKEELKVFIGYFEDSSVLQNKSTNEGSFFIEGLSNVNNRLKSLQEQLNLATNCDVIIFPELTITKECRESIHSWLTNLADNQSHYPPIVLAGSFHEDIDGVQVNRATLFCGISKIFVQDKMRPYYDKKNSMTEDIVPSRKICLLSTSIGLWAMPICKDFSDDLGISWQSLFPDFFLVPSMGDDTTIRAHKRAAKKYFSGCFRTVSIISNQKAPISKDETKNNSMGCIVGGNNDSADLEVNAGKHEIKIKNLTIDN